MMQFKFELDNNVMLDIKEAIMVQFLKDDLNYVKQNIETDYHPDDVKYNKKLLKAYKRILDYYGEDNG
jgi:hypothetical protein